ncbi:MAG: DNA (cytosine-5-)-methyltransferase [Bacilli bacterium]|nr:DNA (cytosine-5-)-methyltransferase [Bacilli bacterium]
MLKVIELFSGVGAQAEALKRSGIAHEVVAMCDIDKYSVRTYRKLHGWTINLGDIKTVEGLPKVDLWTYSFPCTDISISGQMKGFDKGSNTGSSLLWEVQRLLEVSKANNTLPKYLLMENVKNIVSKRFLPLFQEWIDYLSSLGYKSFYKVLNARDYGVPQNRERCFMLSVLNYDGEFEFPETQELKTKLSDLLEKEVEERYFLSDRFIKYACDMENRNGFIRGKRFRPHDNESEVAFTITTNPGGRATDNFVMLPAVGAIRGRPVEGGGYKQKLHVKDEPITNTITTVQKDNVILVPQATKAGYAAAEVGDGIYTNRMKYKRGVVQKSMIPTLKTSVSDVGVVVEDKDELINIRRLTPRECWRLMGWTDERIDVAFSSGVSETQLYKQAGNSIVVNVLTSILISMKNTFKL